MNVPGWRMHSMKLRSTASALKLLSLIFAVSINGSARGAQVGELEKLNVCYSSIAATSITTWVPHEAGIFKKHGLDVNIIYVSGAQAITTLLSGDAHIVQGSGAAAALSRLSGSDATVIGTTINVIPMSLVTRSRYRHGARSQRKNFRRQPILIVDRSRLEKGRHRIGSGRRQRHQNDSNRRRAGDLAFYAAR